MSSAVCTIGSLNTGSAASLSGRPRGSAGWRSGPASASVALLLAWSVLGRAGGIPRLAFGIAGGVLASIAIFRRGERALAVYAALLPLLNALAFLIGSLLSGDRGRGADEEV